MTDRAYQAIHAKGVGPLFKIPEPTLGTDKKLDFK